MKRFIRMLLLLCIFFSTSVSAYETVYDLNDPVEGAAPITEIHVTIEPPAAGQIPSMTASTTTEGITIGEISWQYNPAVFEEGKVYAVSIRVIPDENHIIAGKTLSSIRATLNGRPASLLGKGSNFDMEAQINYVTELYVHTVFMKLPRADYTFPFTDVREGDWYYDSVREANRMELINGVTETTYCPDDNLTYAQAVKLAACMQQLYHTGSVQLTNSLDPFPWYKNYYEYARHKAMIGIVENPTEPTYDTLYSLANELITREHFVYILASALPDNALAPINEIPDDSIPDVKRSDSVWDDGIYQFYRAGIVNGMDDQGTFQPQSNIRRSEVAAILCRMMNPDLRVGAPAALRVQP